MTIKAPLVNVLYGTVNGNAEQIARRIHAELPSKGLRQGVVACLADHATVPAFASDDARADVYNAIVVSTTGDGDPPETIRPFMKLLRTKDKERLAGLNYAVLGLGDTNYENFCKTGKRIDTGLAKLGADRFLARGDADDGIGLELVVEPWISKLWDKLAEFIPADAVAPDADPVPDSVEDAVRAVTAAELGFAESDLPPTLAPQLSVHPLDAAAAKAAPAPPPSLNPAYDPDTTVRAAVSAARLLTASDSAKTVWHAELSASKLAAHRPGAAFGVLVDNAPADVDAMLKFLSHDATDVVRLCDASGERELAVARVDALLRQRPDLRALPSKSLLRALAAHCDERDEAKRLLSLSSRTGRGDYVARVMRPGKSVLAVLRDEAPSCRPPLALLLDLLPDVAPRWYSAASGGAASDPDALHFAFSVVADGLATPALAAKCAAVRAGETAEDVLLLPRASDAESHFRPPPLDTSYVMIGPGTGVAPFRGFLRERRELLAARGDADADATVGKALLFFGCRYEAQDYLYADELQQLRDDGVLDALDVAFSRDGPTKVYVQDRLRARAAEVGEVVRGGGNVYVCGDGGGMAKDVNTALVDILTEQCCDGDAAQAAEMLKQMGKDGRYVRDIWFHGKLEDGIDV